MVFEFNASRSTAPKSKARPFEYDSYDLYIARYGHIELILVVIARSGKYTPVHTYDLTLRLCVTQHLSKSSN